VIKPSPVRSPWPALLTRDVVHDPMTPSLQRGGRSLAHSDNGRVLFAGTSSIDAIASRAGGVSEGVARRRDASRVPQVCPKCVRVFYE
jgi:hypothetical protein